MALGNYSLPVASGKQAGEYTSSQSMHTKTGPWGKIRNSIFVKCFFSCAIAVFLIWQIFFPSASRSKSSGIIDTSLLIDGHNDFPIWIRAFYQNRIYQANFTEPSELYGQVDFPRLRKGHLGGQFWSVYVECPKTIGNHSDEIYHEIIHDTFQQIDLVYRLIKAYPEYLQHATSSRQIGKIFASSPPRIASLLGIEGLHQVGNSASILRIYHSLGVRYATLTHTCHNAYADSEEPAVALHGGLSASGRAMIAEMNRLGMMVDLSHTSFDTQRDVLRFTQAPVIYSHSNAYTLCRHTRNVPDNILWMLKQNRGVVMVTFYKAFLEEEREKASIHSVVEHIMYIGELIGFEHVGIGSDFDGMSEGPRGMEDVARYPDLVRELERRGLKKKDLIGILGLNVLRVLRDVERVAEEKADELPLEDEVKPFFGA